MREEILSISYADNINPFSCGAAECLACKPRMRTYTVIADGFISHQQIAIWVARARKDELITALLTEHARRRTEKFESDHEQALRLNAAHDEEKSADIVNTQLEKMSTEELMDVIAALYSELPAKGIPYTNPFRITNIFG